MMRHEHDIAVQIHCKHQIKQCEDKIAMRRELCLCVFWRAGDGVGAIRRCQLPARRMGGWYLELHQTRAILFRSFWGLHIFEDPTKLYNVIMDGYTRQGGMS